MNAAKESAEQQAWEAVGRRVGVHSPPCINGPDLSVFRAHVMEQMGDRQGLEQLAYRHLGMGDIELVKSFLGKTGGLKDGEIPAHLLEQTARLALVSCHISVARILITELLRINTSADVSAFKVPLKQLCDNPKELIARHVKLSEFHALFQLIERREMTSQEWEDLGDLFLIQMNACIARDAYALASKGRGIEIRIDTYDKPTFALEPRFHKRLGNAYLRMEWFDRARIHFKAINDNHGLQACADGFKAAAIRASYSHSPANYVELAETALTDAGLPPNKEWYLDLAGTDEKDGIRMAFRHEILERADLREELIKLGDGWLKRYEWYVANRDGHFSPCQADFFLDHAEICYKSSKDSTRIKLMGDIRYENGSSYGYSHVQTAEALYKEADHEPADPTYYWQLGTEYASHAKTPQHVQQAQAAFLKCLKLGGNLGQIETKESERLHQARGAEQYSWDKYYVRVDVAKLRLAA